LSFIIEITEQQIRMEKDKARELRKTRWWQNILARGICNWCGATFPKEELTMDHVVPISRGGASSRGNVVPSCKECNSRKKYFLPMEWEEYLNTVKSEK
jgi:5-methylcytosine-specific restriction protein A